VLAGLFGKKTPQGGGYIAVAGAAIAFIIAALASIDYWTSDLGGRTMKDAAIERMLKGYIDLDEVERWCGLMDQRPVY
jgi:hypothetical protein